MLCPKSTPFIKDENLWSQRDFQHKKKDSLFCYKLMGGYLKYSYLQSLCECL